MPKQEKINKSVKKRLDKVANAYNLYATRLEERQTITSEEKNRLLKQFLDNNIDEINAILDKENPEIMGLDDEGLKAAGVGNNAIRLIQAIKRVNEDQSAEDIQDGKLSEDTMESVRNAVLKKAHQRSSKEPDVNKHDYYAEEDDDSPQSKGMRQIAAWMYRNSEVTTLANRQTGKKGKESKLMFIESILAKPVKERLLIYYLVETQKKKCTLDDVIASQTYVPDLERFKKAMLALGIKRFFGKEYVKWDVLGVAAQQAGVMTNASSSSGMALNDEDEYKEHEQVIEQLAHEGSEIKNKDAGKDEEDVEFVLEGLDVEADEAEKEKKNSGKIKEVKKEFKEEEDKKTGNHKYKYDEDIEKRTLDDYSLIPIITKRMHQLITSDNNSKASKETNLENVVLTDEKDREEFKKLQMALAAIQKHIGEHVNKLAQSDPDKANIKVDDITAADVSVFKKAGDGLAKLPLVSTTAAGAALNLAAILIRTIGLIKNRKILNAADKWQRVSEIAASCADFTNSASRLGMYATAFSTALSTTGSTMAGIGAGAMATSSALMTTISGATGVISGGLTMAAGAIDAGRAAQLRKGNKKADSILFEYQWKKKNTIAGYENSSLDYSERIDKYKTDMAFAGNIQAFMKSAYHSRIVKGSTKMISGSLTALGGALTLSGLGAVVGIPLMVGGLATMIAQKIAGAVVSKKNAKSAVDRFLGLDAIMEDPMFEPIKKDKGLMALVRGELRQYGLAQMGAASQTQAYNMVMSKYAQFLWEKIFFLEPSFYDPYDKGSYYRSEEDMRGLSSADEDLRTACMIMVKSMGVKLQFGGDSKTPPKTTVEAIRRRMVV